MLQKMLRILMAVCLLTFAKQSMADAGLYRNNIDGSQTLLGHVPKDVGLSVKKDHVNSSQILDLRVTLPINNESQLDALLKSLYDPSSPNYRHFLTPEQFTLQFGASGIYSQQVKDFLKSKGLTVTGQSPSGLVLNVSGPVSSVERIFGVNINHYQKNDGKMFFAPDAEPTVPVEVVGKISAVGGLDNAIKFESHSHQSAMNNINQPKIVVPKFGTGPGGFLAPKDLYNAYNLNTVPSNGAGQSVALFELDGYLKSDITGYETYFQIPNVPLQNVLIDGFNGNPSGNGGNAEVTLDIELVAAFAPGLSNIYVYEAGNTWQAWVDEWTRLANDKDKSGNLLVSIVSCSWGLAERYSPEMTFDNAIFKQMAAQGQAVFVASGDNGAYDAGGTTLAVDEPAAQPYVTAVGISKLSVNTDGSYSSEAASLYGGGGISADQAIPSYQQGVISKASLGSTTMRNVPDVALTADPATAHSFYISGAWSGYWGSSLAAPIWASFMARVNQGRVNSNQGSMGFVNPQLYQIAKGSNYTTDFHDISAGNNSFYPAEPGYDDAIGLGSFNGANLYKDLVGAAKIVLLPAVPSGVTAVSGNGQVQLSWNSSSGAVSYNVKRSTVSGGPYTSVASTTFTSFIDNKSLLNGTAYYYVVSAVNSVGESSNSAQVKAMPLLPVPSAPTGLLAMPGNNQVALSWNASAGAVSYNVKRATVNGGPYTILISATTNRMYTDTTPKNGTVYFYVVSAVNAGGESPNSGQFMVTPFAPPTAPAGLTATAGKASVTLSWNAVSGAYWYYVVRSVNGGPYFTIGSPTANSFTDKSALKGVKYYYAVATYLYVNGVGAISAYSSPVSATPQ
ncbi:MAG: hypothetical protein HQL12_08925 [Candidatus Omnitrophica bacterium]|nr:hypothetical protein [Candidatus Omnitrophota bacterium]